MLTQRIIVCLDVMGGRVVKGTRFVGLRDVGDPAELAARAEGDGADEIVLLDISASAEERSTLLRVVERTASRLFVPLTVGGGVRSVEDVGAALRAGADKVSLNSPAVSRPALMTESAARFGAQCVVVSIDAKREGDRWSVYTKGGREPTGLEAVTWAAECATRGAGEVLLTSIDRDGTRSGYDLALTRAVTAAVNVPVIASGGGGTGDDVADALLAGADAALVAGIVHDGVCTVNDLKRIAAARGCRIRPTAVAA